MKKIEFILSKKKEIFYIFALFLFSISINQYYGNLGLCPIDSFWFFNSGYDALNGYYPFKDYWVIAGPFITFVQAILFKIFGVSWFTYVLHASLFNFLISIVTFYTLCKLKLNINFSFFYSLLVASLAYTSAGTPFVDHHASILSIISLLFFILAIKTNSVIYWFILPITLLIAFLTKQTPSGYIGLIIIFFTIIYFLLNFDLRKIFYAFLGSVTIILFFLLILFLTSIPFASFFEQYISFPSEIGKIRIEYFLFPLEFSRIFLRFKLIHIPLFFLIFIIVQKIRNNPKYIKNNDFIIILSLITTSYALIAHQLMTINGLYIFFIIPIIAAFSHIYFMEHYKSKNYVLYSLLILSICSTLHYGYKYIHKRDFMDLRKANFNLAIDAKIFDNKLSGLKWISCHFPNNPKEEVSNLIEAIDIIKNDSRKKSIITEYQFISVILSTYDYSPSAVWFINHVVNQKKDSKYFKSYKIMLTNQIKKNNIQVVYLIKPFWQDNKIFEKGLNPNCYSKIKLTEILDAYTIQKCDEL